ncbi:aminopeptidase [Paenibacillus phyllosphaerae]|uniref:Aminopeptidase n=1 Tax=Paenibacillus phyllosphaerae TaxID=274593 RepID=A0A7W5FPC7_9BACL|nr:aminopeptidase [Paenibacillus phyllosphaerae]MBB3112092.1 aminopeptidase [Paenibacillus phyllosphaerae]
MTQSFQDRLAQYAALAVEIGVNVQPGKDLYITAQISAAEFVRAAAKHAYTIGAKQVHVEWIDNQLVRTRFELAPEDSFGDYPAWQVQGRLEVAKEGGSFLTVISEDPDLLAGIDPKRLGSYEKARQAAFTPVRAYTMTNKAAWAIVGVPSQAWANKVFPGLPEAERVDALWNAIFAATRVDEADPIAAWRAHAAKLDEKAAWLNEQRFTELRYRAPGTELSIGLDAKHIWKSAGSVTTSGTTFIPNLPTEEVFTSPDRSRVNGTVTSSKPLSYNGTLIDNFSLTFKDGQVVDFTAEKEYDSLKNLIDTDEGSKFLGEVALVPHRSPISDTNLLFFNTLFDENAACHLAIGFGFPFCLDGGLTMSKEELAAHGLNQSLTHVDFMIGRADLDIDGVRADGTVEPIFRAGNWA